MSVPFNTLSVFNTAPLGMYMVYPHTRFLTPSSNDLLIITIKRGHKYRFCMPAMLLLYIPEKLP